MSGRAKYCSPRCEFFECGQRAVIHRGQNVYCRWVDEKCSGYTCNYAIRFRNRLLPSGKCGLTVKRKTVELEPEENEEFIIKRKSRILRRLRDEEIM